MRKPGPGLALPWWVLIGAAILWFVLIAPVQARWGRTLTISGEIGTGSASGAVLQGSLAAAGFCEPAAPGQTGAAQKCLANAVFGVKGKVCISNQGDSPTKDLAVVNQVEFKDKNGQYLSLTKAALNIPAGRQLNPTESDCFDYRIVFEPAAALDYQITAAITVSNYKDWSPGEKNCPGPAVCPYGPAPAAGFSLAGFLSEGSPPAATPTTSPPITPPAP